MPRTKKGKQRTQKKKETSIEPPSDNYKFDKQEVILCYHGPALYKAKILKRTVQKNNEREEVMYYVHYHGWNKQWDEWVQASRCVKFTQENIEKQQELLKKLEAVEESTKASKKNEKKPKKKNRKRQIEDSEEDTDSDENASAQTNSNDANTNSSNAQNNSNTSAQNSDKEYLQSLYHQQAQLKKEDLDDLEINNKIKIHEAKQEIHKAVINDNINHKHMKMNTQLQNEQDEKRFKEKLKTIVIPTSLQNNLVEQYELIHSYQKLIQLPKQKGFSINDILQEALNVEQRKLIEKQEKKNEDDIKAQQNVVELLPFVMDGMKGYFKNTLYRNLLYNFEKLQYEQITSANKGDLCAVYGAEHLIRLFYILPNILFHTKGINESNFGQIKQCISVIIQFLNKNKGKYLIDYTMMENIDSYVQHVDNEYIRKSNEIAQKY